MVLLRETSCPSLLPPGAYGLRIGSRKEGNPLAKDAITVLSLFAIASLADTDCLSMSLHAAGMQLLALSWGIVWALERTLKLDHPLQYLPDLSSHHPPSTIAEVPPSAHSLPEQDNGKRSQA